jgi:hypothetical protein
VNVGPTDVASNFFFDYSTIGIPSAPNSVGGSTRGMKLQANMANGIFGGFSVSPTGQAFTGDYSVSFDFWLNFNGPAPVGGSGSTQAAGAGIRTAGTTPQWAGGTQDSIYFALTLDGNSASDYRAYAPAAATSYTAASGVYAAGTGTSPDARNQSHPYYSSFGGVTPPAAQTALFPQQTGATLVGSLGFGWHSGTIVHSGGVATFTVDNLLIATVDVAAAGALGGNNIHFTHFDTNATSSSDPNDLALLFSLFDNVVVEQIPEPGTAALALTTLLVPALRRRRRA